MNMVEFLSQLSKETEILLTLSIILFSGFIMTRLTNTLNMPKVSGYILAGILIGPHCLNFIPLPMIEGMGFVSDLALAFIAFSVGKFFKKEVLLRTGKRIIVITISEAMAAGILVTLSLKLLFRLDWEFALMLGAIATATAPASTMMTINQYKAKGEFVDTLLQIVALDDVVCLLAFSIVSAVINGNASGSLSAHDILFPVVYNILVIAMGAFCGYFLSRLLVPTRSRDNRLILAIAMLLGLSGICAALDISPLLSCMVFGAVYINLTRDKKLFRQINSFTPPVMSCFFIVSGMNLDLGAMKVVGGIGVSYFLIRIIGKYLGTYMSCQLMGTSRAIRNYMGLALIPQAGVAIGLAFLAQRMLPPSTGNMVLTIILSSSVLYELVGPISARAALIFSGSIPYIKAGAGVEGTRKDEGMKELEEVEEEPGKAEEEAEKEPGKAEEEAEKEPGKAEEEPEKEPEGAEKEPGEAEKEPEKAAEAESGKTEKKRGKPRKKSREAEGKSEKESGKTEKESEENTSPEEIAVEAESNPELMEEEDHAVLPELAEYNKDADESDNYDIEKELKPQKSKKKKKGKKARR